jgi:hypothetical protein
MNHILSIPALAGFVLLAVACDARHRREAEVSDSGNKNGAVSAAEARRALASKSLPGTPDSIRNGAAVNKYQKYIDLAMTDPAAALAAIAAELSPDAQREARCELLSAVGRQRLDAVPMLAAAIDDLRARESILFSVGQDWAKRAPQQLFEFALGNMQGNDRNLLLVRAVRSVIDAHDFATGQEMLAAMPPSADRSNTLLGFANAFATSDPTAAVSWASSLSEKDQPLAFMALVGIVAKSQGMDGLNAALQGTSDPKVRAPLLQAAASLVCNQDDASIQNWVSQLSDAERPRGLEQLIMNAPNDRVASYANFISNERTSSNVVATYALAGRLAKDDPAAAEQWVMNLPSTMRSYGIGGLVSVLFSTDSTQLASWLQTIPEGGDRDSALEQAARVQRSSNKQAALEFAGEIHDSGLRKKTLDYVGN